jgi:hypothetical protein
MARLRTYNRRRLLRLEHRGNAAAGRRRYSYKFGRGRVIYINGVRYEASAVQLRVVDAGPNAYGGFSVGAVVEPTFDPARCRCAVLPPPCSYCEGCEE